MALRVWCLALCLWACAPALAAVPELPRFRVLGAADGLPATTIPALARDRDGYLWIATWDGLARYDGVDFRIWRHEPDNPTSLPGNVLQALHIDAQDRIWVATEGGGMSVMDGERKGFRHYRLKDHPQMGSDEVFAFASRGDELWFGTFEGGLHRLHPDGRIDSFRADPQGSGLPSDTVLALANGKQGELWIGTMEGLARFDGRDVRRVDLPDGIRPLVYSITPLDGVLWVGTSQGLLQWRGEGDWTRPSWSQMFVRPNAVMGVFGDGRGQYWIASQGGLWHTEGDGAPTPVTHDEQAVGIGRVVQTALQQRDGGMWVPVPTRGLAYLRADWRRIAAFAPAQGLGGGLYRGLATGTGDALWLASSTGKVERLDMRSGEITPLGLHEELLRELRLTALQVDARQHLWLGHRQGLIEIDPASGALRSWGPGQAVDAVPDTSSVDWIVVTSTGRLWLSTQVGGVQQRDLLTGKVLYTRAAGEGGAAQNDIQALARAPDDGVWLAGDRGMERWDEAAGRFRTVASLGSERVFAVAFEGADRLWLHRLSGLEAWRLQADGQWTRTRHIGGAEGLPAVESTGVAIDGTHRVWVATRRGLYRVEPSTGEVRNYGVRDGMLSQEFNDRALLMAADGILAGSAADGSVMLLDTTLPDPAPVLPPLVIDSLHVTRDSGPVALPRAGGFELQPGDHELHVVSRLLSYDDPSDNRYRSRLEGFDKDWVEQGANGERVFSSLAPGDYVLRVRAFDGAGNASVERTLRFSVRPPWWRSAWGLGFFAIVGALLLAWASASYRKRLRRRHSWQLAVHKRELAEQASLAKTRFLATLGHEVRTPMTGVLGMSELLLGTGLDERQRGYTHAIQNAGKHLMRLVNDALDIARIEAGKLELQQQEFDVGELIAEVVALAEPLAAKRGLRFESRLAPDTPRALRGDPLRVRQILLNLLANAIKFTERGEVVLEVSGPATPQRGGGGLQLVVTDTGPGLSEEQRTRLFQRFEQAEGARTTARYGGSGLGLAICQELALAMGGRIDVESTPGEGARFIVELPLPHADEVPVRVAGATPAHDPESPPLRLLLVEDDATVAEVIVGLLQARGHSVEHAPHGLAALSAMANASFDAVLLDLDLPGMDGLALARQLREQGVVLPLAAVTARADGDAEAQAMDAGFDAFVRKPVTGELLAETLARARAAARTRMQG